MSKLRFAGSLIAVSLFVALAWFASPRLGWSDIRGFWLQAGVETSLYAAAGLLLSHLARGERLYHLLARPEIDRLSVYSISIWHTAANNLLPFRSGEATLPLLLRQWHAIHWREGAIQLALVRLLDLSALLSVWALSLTGSWLLGAGGAVVLVFISTAIVHFLPTLLGKLPARWRPQLALAPGTLWRTPAIVGLTGLAWITKFLGLWMLALTAFPHLQAASATAIVATELSSVTPLHGPAGLGSYEAAFALPMLNSGVSMEHAIAVALQLHGLLLAVSFALAGLSLFARSLRHKTITNQ